MDKNKAKNRIAKLSAEINKLRYEYHVLDKPDVTDSVYDSLTAELRALEEQFPDLRAVDSPTQKIGGRPLDKFQKVRHAVRQWSFDDVFSLDELKKWEEKMPLIFLYVSVTHRAKITRWLRGSQLHAGDRREKPS